MGMFELIIVVGILCLVVVVPIAILAIFFAARRPSTYHEKNPRDIEDDDKKNHA